jgi:hypothetical protein
MHHTLNFTHLVDQEDPSVNGQNDARDEDMDFPEYILQREALH